MIPPTSTPPREAVLRLAPAVGLLAVLAALASSADQPERGELVFVGGTVALLLALAGLTGRSGAIARTGAVALFAALVVLPPGPSRGAVAGAVAVGAFAVAVGSRLRASAAAAALAGVALGVQIALRPAALFPATLAASEVARFVLPPLVLAGALVWSRRSTAASLATLLAVAWVAEGITASTALGVLAVAAGVRWAAERTPTTLAVVVASVVAAFAWEPRLGLVAAAGAAAAAGFPAVGAGLAAAGLGGVLALSGPGGLAAAGGLALVLPAGWATPPRRLGPAVVLALAAAALVAGPSGLAVPAALLALGFAPHGRWTLPQLAWSGSLVAAAGLAAAYPWLQPRPAAAVTAGLGLGGAAGAAVALATVAALAALSHASVRTRAAGWAAVGLVLVAGLAARLPGPGVDLLAEPATLRPPVRRWRADLPAGAVARVTVDSLVTDSGAVPPGAPVAEVAVIGRDGVVASMPLRLGVETGDWAARRAGGRELPASARLAWVAGEGGELAQRYRATWRFDPPIADPLRVRVVRARGLPRETGVALLGVEVAPR